MSTQTTIGQIDAENEVIVLARLDPATGLPVADRPRLSLGLGDLAHATGANAKVVLRRWHMIDSVTGVKKRLYVPSTRPESDTTEDGYSDETEDVYLTGGGGGGGGRMVKMQEDMGDYLSCKSWNPTTEELGEVELNVAKPVEFRPSGVVVVQPYAVGDVLIALTVDHTGVMFEEGGVETEITMMDANVCGRAVGTEFHYRDFANGCHEYKTWVPMLQPVFVA